MKQTGESLHMESAQGHGLRHVDWPREEEFLRAITLEGIDIDEAWLREFDHHIEHGSVALNSNSQHGDTVRSRQAYEDLLGLNFPAHTLHGAWKTINNGPTRQTRRQPVIVLNTLRELSGIAGDTPGAIKMVQGCHYLLSDKADNIRFRFAYLKRMAVALHWQGDPKQALHEAPDLLGTSRKKLAVLGQIAALHAPRDYTGGLKKVAPSLPVEPHIWAIIQQGEDYQFGQRSWISVRRQSSGQLRERIYGALEDPKVIEIIGTRVLRAYFRFRPPTKIQYERYPHLRYWERSSIVGAK